MQFSSSELQWAAAKKSNINSPVAIHLVWILDFRRPFWCCGSYVHFCGTYVTQLNATRRFYWSARERESEWSLLKFYWFFFLVALSATEILCAWLPPKIVAMFLTIFILSLNNSVICFYHTKTNLLCYFSLLQRERVRPADEALQNGL